MSNREHEPEAFVGYVVKRVQVALRNGLDEALRPLDLTTSQYTCLRLLRHDPGTPPRTWRAGPSSLASP